VTKLPKSYTDFQEAHPEVFRAYEQLGTAVHAAGPLDAKTRGLIKLAMAIAGRHEGAVHAHVRRLREAGVSAEEMRQVVLLAIPTIGFPAAMAAMSWVEDLLE